MAEIDQAEDEAQVKVLDPHMRELRTAMVIDAICGVFFLGFYLFCRSKCPDYRPLAWLIWTGAFFRIVLLYYVCWWNAHVSERLNEWLKIKKWNWFFIGLVVSLVGSVPPAVMFGCLYLVVAFLPDIPPLMFGACIASFGFVNFCPLLLIEIASYMLKARVWMKWCAWTIWSCILWGWVSSVCFSHFRDYDPFLCLLAPFGNAEAQFDLGVCYSRGDIFSQSIEKAVKWYRKAAEQGLPEAQSALGRCYGDGNGVKQSYEEAVKWYRKAAEQGHPGAQYSLGRCYANGDGVKQSYEEAVKWYQEAAVQGNPDVWYALGECYENGNGVEQSLEYATAWYEAAAKRYRCFAEKYDSAKAKYRLGDCYEKGRGVEKSLEEAARWYHNAAEQGHEKAKAALERLQKKE